MKIPDDAVINCATDLTTICKDVMMNATRFTLLTKLIWATLQDWSTKMPEGITSAEVLVAGDMLVTWALHQGERECGVSKEIMCESWALCLAYRYGLIPDNSQEHAPAN